ncbi:NitT/TauT family transport system substrate-binding protein [Oxalobacteraceae bacterium GrIS 2.11]
MMSFILRSATKLFALLALSAMTLPSIAAAPLKIGYSDWPGWVAWQVALEKGWFKEAGVDVTFEWFDYSASMDAFSAGKLDAVNVTNGDAVLGAAGAKSSVILITDYSNGNDMIVAKPGIAGLKGLKGKKVGLEYGLMEHLLLLNGLHKAGMNEADVTLVKAPTNELPQVLAAPDIAAIGAWQPVSGNSMRQVPGAKAIYTSADEPGLIYDVLAVNPVNLAAHRADWLKVIKVWYRMVAYINDPKTSADAIKIMAARVGLNSASYAPLLGGTKILTLDEAKAAFIKADGLKSIYGSGKNVDSFNVKYQIYKKPQDIDKTIDPSLTKGL